MISRNASRMLRGLGLSQRRLNLRRYRSIDEFNKQKKAYDFGPEIDNFGSESQHSRLLADFQHEPSLELHPKLQNLEPNLAEYKYQLMLLQQEFQHEKQRERAKWETRERMKGLGAGVVALVGILATYQVVMNYKYLKAYFKGLYAYDVDVSQVRDMNDPKKNKKTVANLVDRFTAEADPAFVLALQDLRSVPGVYLFGAVSGKKLPARVAGFDGMFMKDVLVTDDYVVAVDDKGRVFHYNKSIGPVQVQMPGKVRQVLNAGGNFFYVAQNQKEIYLGGKLTPGAKPNKGWFTSTVVYPVEKVGLQGFGRRERIDSAVAGADHLLLLTSQGRLFGVNAAEVPQNKGQFGLPRYAPTNLEIVPQNTAFELLNLNNEVVALLTGTRTVKPRQFSAIAATKYTNAALELNGNLWTWGDNSACQCGRTIASADDTQPVPKMVYSSKDLARIAKYSLEDVGKNGTFSVEDLAAASNTFFVKMAYHAENRDQDLILSFGDGLKGQLGISRYVHMSHTPLVLKSLVGMREYDEETNTAQNIGIKSIVGGGDHVFVTLDNAGLQKEVLVFGDNLQGQFGNGRIAKSAKPSPMPKLLEPEDFDGSTKKLALKLNDQNRNRLQLGDGDMKGVEQVIAAGEHSSALFYRRK